MHHRGPTLSVLSVGGLCVVLPRLTPDGDATRVIVSATAVLAAQGPVYLLFVAPAQLALPSQETREGVQRMLADLGDALAGVSAVIEGSGFGAAAKRSVFTFVTSVLSRRTRVQVSRDLDEGLGWVFERAAQSTPLEVDGFALAAAIREERERALEAPAAQP